MIDRGHLDRRVPRHETSPVGGKISGHAHQHVDLVASDAAIERLRGLSFVDEVIQGDARRAVEIMKRVSTATSGRMADVVINVANIPETEMSCILSCRNQGIVYFFSMATSFTRAALGAEGVGADVDLRIGNGYTAGHADLSLDILRESSELRRLFTETYS